MSKQIVWVEGARVPKGLKAEAAYGALEAVRLKSGGILKPADVVDDARPVDAVLHPAFEWDDAVAAERHREDQARLLIRSVRVIIAERPDEGPRRTYIHVETQDDSAYVTTARALSEPELRAQVLSKAKSDLASFRARYRDLTELSDIFAAIDKVLEPEAVSAVNA